MLATRLIEVCRHAHCLEGTLDERQLAGFRIVAPMDRNGSAAPVRSLDQQTYRQHLMPAGITRYEGPLRRFRQRARSQSDVCCTLGPVVGDTIFLVGERPEVAGSGC